jgi:hypothetical protein
MRAAKKLEWQKYESSCSIFGTPGKGRPKEILSRGNCQAHIPLRRDDQSSLGRTREKIKKNIDGLTILFLNFHDSNCAVVKPQILRHPSGNNAGREPAQKMSTAQ